MYVALISQVPAVSLAWAAVSGLAERWADLCRYFIAESLRPPPLLTLLSRITIKTGKEEGRGSEHPASRMP